MPEVTPADFDRTEWLRGWAQDLKQRLNALADGTRTYRVEVRAAGDGHAARSSCTRPSTARRARSTCRASSSSPPSTSASPTSRARSRGLIGEGAYVTRGDERQEIGSLQGGDEVAVRAGEEGPDASSATRAWAR